MDDKDDYDEQAVMLDQEEEGGDNFINPEEAVEVEVDDDNVPMDEEEEEEMEDEMEEQNDVETPDMSITTIQSHNQNSIYAVSSYFDESTNTLQIVTGGGDDRAFLHISHLKDANNNIFVSTKPLKSHSDSVSCAEVNYSYALNETDTKYMAVGSYDGSVAIYTPDGSLVTTLEGPTDVEFLSFHPKGGSVLLAGSIADATVWMFHVPTAKCMQVFVGHECIGEGGGVTDGTFTPDGKFALTVGMDGTARLWAPRTGVCRHVFKLSQHEGSEMSAPAGLICLAVNGGIDGQLAVAGGEDGIAHVMHLSGKKVVTRLAHFDSLSVPQSDEDSVLMSIEGVGFAPKSVNPNWIATGGSDGKLKIWDLTHGDGQCRQVCTVANNSDEIEDTATGGITRLIWHPHLPIVFASYTDGNVRVWDARNGRSLTTLYGGKLDNQINDLCVQVLNTEQGSILGPVLIITATDDGESKIFKVDMNLLMNDASR